MPKLVLNPLPVTNPPTSREESFITSPKVDAYEPYTERTWAEFEKSMRHQAMCWGFESCERSHRFGGYRYPAIGFFGDRKFALFAPTGDPKRVASADLQMVEVEWPSNWNVT
jgi:hypothetical protein